MQGGLAGSWGSGFPAWPPDAGPQRANTAPRTGFIELGLSVGCHTDGAWGTVSGQGNCPATKNCPWSPAVEKPF